MMNSDKLWEILKEVCCADPKNAKRIVLLNKKKLEEALRIWLISENN